HRRRDGLRWADPGYAGSARYASMVQPQAGRTQAQRRRTNARRHRRVETGCRKWGCCKASGVMKRLSHINRKGEAAMVDVSAKPVQQREAVARGEIHLQK